MFCFCGCENKNSADLTTQEVAVDKLDSSVEEPVAVERVEVDEPGLNGYTICIDAGHQQKAITKRTP